MTACLFSPPSLEHSPIRLPVKCGSIPYPSSLSAMILLRPIVAWILRLRPTDAAYHNCASIPYPCLLFPPPGTRPGNPMANAASLFLDSFSKCHLIRPALGLRDGSPCRFFLMSRFSLGAYKTSAHTLVFSTSVHPGANYYLPPQFTPPQRASGKPSNSFFYF